MKKALLLAAILTAIDLITPAIDTGAQVAVIPVALIMGIVSMIAAQKQAADQKQAQQQAASANAAKSGGSDNGMNMTPVFKNADKSQDTRSGNEFWTQGKDGDMSAHMDPSSGLKGILGDPLGGQQSPAESRINQSIFAKNGNPAADTTGATPAVDIPTDDLDVVQIPKDVPSEVSGKQGMFGDMSTADKVAMAATLGSMLRGSDRQMPAPGRGGAGGPGINMQPVFQNTIRDLYR